MLILALLVAALIPMLLDGLAPFSALLDFPLARLTLILALVMGCWNLNALRLRLLLAGRGGSRDRWRAQQDGVPTTPSPMDRALTRFSSTPLGQRRAVAMVMATECATCATPGGSGGPLTLMMLLKRHGVHPATSSGIFVIDQICDMLFFLLALTAMGGYALLHPNAWPRPELIQLASAVLVMLLVMMTLLLMYLPRVLRLSRAPLEQLGISQANRRRLSRHMLHFRQGLAITLGQPPLRLATIFALCSTHWITRYSLLYLTLDGLGVDIAWVWTFMVQMLAMAAGQLSLLPGGAGGVELTIGAFLLPSLGGETTAAAILIWRFVTYHWYLLAGAPVLAWLARPIIVAGGERRLSGHYTGT
ncbi:lysylphosphatidylglycerol synthase transmembrane domain-containing protein [Halomonas salinarum]|uniref:lysylphosphatidylglycerol synthase transmembrane domain-containing protein n=1 Tax=Halomonas salinarum TaxID=1158993 RepID=UPI00143C3FE6|nr:lysylphosphatidylglycerol synthase transmembrane domain-containing protein [Halomonas salinarum]